MDFEIYRGDTLPDLRITLYSDDEPVRLSGAEQIRVIGVRNRSVLFDHPGTGNDEGVVVMEWAVEDTANTGEVKVEVEVTWDGGKKQTFRPDDVVRIKADFG